MASKLNKPQSVNYLLYSMGGGAFLGSIINSYSLPYDDYNIDYMSLGIQGAICGAGAGIFLPLTLPFMFVGLSTGILLHENNDKGFVEDYVNNLS